MKSLKLLFAIIITGTLFSSCTEYYEDSFDDRFQNQISLEEVVSSYDLWYVDYHRTSGSGDVPYVSKAFTLFANKGKCILDKTHISESQAKRINAIMLTCGFYDEAGEFAFEVGLPGKSGVGGGIVALLPDHFVITTWSPGLNKKGNSLLGMQALEQFTTKTKLSVF